MQNKKFSKIDDIIYVQKQDGLRTSLGSGSFGQVRLVSHKNDSSKKYAMKKIKNTNLTEMKIIYQEIQLHQNLNHPNIIKFEDYLEQNKEVYMFLEYAENGDLFGYINRNRLQEKELLRLFYQTCLAIQYLHSRNIMHRDLKPENILVDRDRNIKVCDFGWSAIYRENEIRETVCGTLEYMAPEIFMKKRQTKKTDVWALGILLYELFHNFAPFRGGRADIILRQIRVNKKKYKETLNLQIKQLIEKILNLNPLMRPSIEEILQSPLFDQFKSSYQSNMQKMYSVKKLSKNQSQYSTKWIDTGFSSQQKPQNNVVFKFQQSRKNSHTTQDTQNEKLNSQKALKTRPVSRRKIVIDNQKRDYSAQVKSQRVIQIQNNCLNFVEKYQLNKPFNSNGFTDYTRSQKKEKSVKKGPGIVVNLEKSFASYLKNIQII